MIRQPFWINSPIVNMRTSCVIMQPNGPRDRQFTTIYQTVVDIVAQGYEALGCLAPAEFAHFIDDLKFETNNKARKLKWRKKNYTTTDMYERVLMMSLRQTQDDNTLATTNPKIRETIIAVFYGIDHKFTLAMPRAN